MREKMAGQTLKMDVMKKIAFQLSRLDPIPRNRVFRYIGERQDDEMRLLRMASVESNGQTKVNPPNPRVGLDLDER